jgi:hypothetical protein
MNRSEYDVLVERAKQRRKWGSTHDDEHFEGEIAVIAAELAISHVPDAEILCPESEPDQHIADEWGLLAKHRGVRRRLVIAAALIIAEIDRLERRSVRRRRKKS